VPRPFLLVALVAAIVAAGAVSAQGAPVPPEPHTTDADDTRPVQANAAASADDDKAQPGLGVLSILAGLTLLAVGLQWHRRR